MHEKILNLPGFSGLLALVQFLMMVPAKRNHIIQPFLTDPLVSDVVQLVDGITTDQTVLRKIRDPIAFPEILPVLTVQIPMVRQAMLAKIATKFLLIRHDVLPCEGTNPGKRGRKGTTSVLGFAGR
jgi:hypothetical protein